jgi:hypothetical protein
MRNSIFSMFVICFVTLFGISLYAGGLGIAFPFGTGSTDYDIYEADASQFGINFVFDSNVAKRSVFNYRLNFGVEIFNHEYEYDYYDYYWDYYVYGTGSVEGIKIVTDHTFGFGIVKTSVVRLWLGPNVRFGFIAADESSGISLGGGLTALGLNLNFGPVFTLGLEAGYLFNADIFFDDVIYEDTYYSYESSSAGLSNMFVAKLSILFRIHDTYDDFF